jgi:hypothetical protein
MSRVRINRSLSIWTLRVMLAALFFFGSEIILWLNIQNYGLVDWLIRIIGYLLLATLLIDIAVRYRIRDVYDAMVLLAGYALLHSIIISPEIGWQSIPDSLLTRIIGSEALTGIILWGVFLTFLRGDFRKYHFLLIGGLFWLGFFWGTWMRWIPELRGTFEAVPLSELFTYAGIVFFTVILLYGIATSVAKEHQAENYLLTPLEWGIALLIIIILFLYQAVLATISTPALIIAALLITLSWLILWFRRTEEQISLIETHLPLKDLHPLWIAASILVYVATTIFAYLLPLAELAQFNQLWLMELGFFAVGIFWLPLVATVLAMRGMDRAMREGQSF